jgi:hypothetical protein
MAEKNETIAVLQAELDEQNEYQEMVAKLAESVNRRKPGNSTTVLPKRNGLGMTAPRAGGGLVTHALDRTVPTAQMGQPINPIDHKGHLGAGTDAEEFSQPFY